MSNRCMLAVAFCMLLVLPLRAQTSALEIIFPGGGEKLVAGTTQSIKWSSTSPGLINIELWNGANGQWLSIANNISSGLRSFSWTIPEHLQGEMFRVRISLANGSNYTLSEGYFTILPAKSHEELPEFPDNRTIFDVFPNPAKSVIHIRCKSEISGTITLRNLLGVKLFEQFGNHAVINVRDLPDGTYVADIVCNDGKHYSQKVVINK